MLQLHSFIFPINDSFAYVERLLNQFQPGAPHNLHPALMVIHCTAHARQLKLHMEKTSRVGYD